MLSVPYYGELIGSFSTLAHDVNGMVYAASPTKLIIRGFTYDGTAPGTRLRRNMTTLSKITGCGFKLRTGLWKPLPDGYTSQTRGLLCAFGYGVNLHTSLWKLLASYLYR